MDKIKAKPDEKKASEPKVPTDLRKALVAAPLAQAKWKDITPIARRDFISWIDGAKQQETRIRRIKVACSKLASGKRRPCCYAVVPMGLYKALAIDLKAKAVWKDLTPDIRRDFVGLIDEARNSEERTALIEKACAMLASGRRHP